MKYARILVSVVLVGIAYLVLPGNSAYAAFHCIRIHAVMGGFAGDNTIQYVELRQSIAFTEVFVSGQKIRFFDAAGTLKATFTFDSNVVTGAVGDSILIATQEFNATAQGGTADFVFTNANTVGANAGDPLHPVQTPSGKVTFAEGAFTCQPGGPNVVDSVAYGSFTGTVDYGASPAPALPSPSDNRALRLSNLNLEASNNATEYSLQPVSTSTFSVPAGSLSSDFTTPRNNSRQVLLLPLSVGGVAELPDVATAPLQTDGSSSGLGAGALTGIAAAAALGVTAVGVVWYVWRRAAVRG